MLVVTTVGMRELHPHGQPLHVGDALDVIDDDRFLLGVFALLDLLPELRLDLHVLGVLLDDAHRVIELFLRRHRAADDRLVLVEGDGQVAIALGRKVILDLQHVGAAVLEGGDEVAVDLALGVTVSVVLPAVMRFDQEDVVADIGLNDADDALLREARVVDRAGKGQPLRFVELM